jgi:hypothetical protein
VVAVGDGGWVQVLLLGSDNDGDDEGEMALFELR